VGWPSTVRCPIGARQPTPEREKAGRRKEMEKGTRLSVLDVAEWVAYSYPATDIDYPEPWFRVIAPAEWTGERVEETLRNMGYDVAYVLEIGDAIQNLMADAYFVGVPIGERILWAVASLPKTVVELPSGRKMTLPVMDLGVWRRTIIFPSSFPKANVEVHHEVDQKWQVIKIRAKGVPTEMFQKRDISFYGRTYSERLGEVLSDFSPIELLPYIVSDDGDRDTELEIEIPVQVADLQQISILCKLIKGLTEKLLREGFITYLTGKRGKALPEEVLEFLTQEEFQILQSLKD
jgi:hypothetical protein